MTLAQLRYAITVANSNSMNEAARTLFISQPSLSSAIKELEEEIEENESDNKRVPKPRPFSAAGSEYKIEVKTTQPQYSNKGTTHPKNGKKKNSKKKGSKK